jgi:hypothetical protein
MADDLERLLGRDRRPHRHLDVLGVTYFQDIHANPPALPDHPCNAPRIARHPPPLLEHDGKKWRTVLRKIRAGRPPRFDPDRNVYRMVRPLSKYWRACRA